MFERTETIDENDRDVPPETGFQGRVGVDVHNLQFKLFNGLDLSDNFQYIVAQAAPFTGIQNNRRW